MEKVEAWKGSDGKLYASSEEARRADGAEALRSRIEAFCSSHETPRVLGEGRCTSEDFGEWLFRNAGDLREVLREDVGVALRRLT